eukprot:g3418.t1
MRQYTLSDVSKHNKKNDCWIVIDGCVYDITKFLSRHPGGPAPIFFSDKGDCGDVFHNIHDANVLARIGHKFLIGKINGQERTKNDERKNNSDGGKSYYDVKLDPEGYDQKVQGREFGDHMSKEGETSHVPTIILIMYGMLYAWSWIASKVTGCSIWTMFFYYLAGMAAFYLWHVLAHSEFMGEMHSIHMEHHLERFPPTDFYGSAELYAQMYPNGKPTIFSLMDLRGTTSIADGTSASREMDRAGKRKHTPLAHEGPLLLFLILILVVGFIVFKTSLLTLGFVFVLFLVVSIVGNALHMSFHVRGFHLEKFEWYRELRALHYIHHLGDMKSNLAMLNLGMDGLFGSL